ncbi:MAG: LysM peptidoglycan-binding domain-containing protein [Xanthomonadales bacterium]|nr:LysM peptidoglycan-binding domain-containing protein [Xanthomonadales bacterium]
MRGVAGVAALVLLLALLAGPVSAQQTEDTLGLHVVQPGETLWDITRLYLGEDFLWKENWRLNPEIEDPNKLRVGQQITVIKERKITADSAVVSSLSNQVDKNLRRTQWLPAARGDQLAEQDGIRTRRSSSAELRFNDNSTLRLSEYSQVFLEEKSTSLRGVDSGRIEVRRGSAELVFQPLTKRRTEIELVSGSAVSRPQPDIGGQARVAAATDEETGSARVMVYRGESEVQASGQTVEVKAGMGTAVPRDGPPQPPEKLLSSPDGLAPADGSVWQVANRSMSWQAVPGASSYRVEVCLDARCAELVQRSDAVDQTRWSPQLDRVGDYFWRVRAVAPSGLEGYASEPSTFRLASITVDRLPPSVAVVPLQKVTDVEGRPVMAPGSGLLLSAFDAGIGVAWVEYRWPGGEWSRNPGPELEIALPESGVEYLDVRASDYLGQVSEQRRIRLD